MTIRRLLLRREPDKSFTLLGTVMREADGRVTILNQFGEEETVPRRGLLFVNVGSIPHFLNLHPGLLPEVFEEEPRAVLEQVLVDAKGPLSPAQLKEKLIQSGISSTSLEASWAELRKALDASTDVKVNKQGQTKYEWNSTRESRLQRFLPGERSPSEGDEHPPHTTHLSGHTSSLHQASEQPRGSAEIASATTSKPGAGTQRHPEESEPEATPDVDGSPSSGAAAKPVPEDSSQSAFPSHPLLDALRSILGATAPSSLEQVAGSTLNLGRALSEVSDKDLGILTRLPEISLELANLLLAARDREASYWKASDPTFSAETVESVVSGAIAEAARASAAEAPRLARRLQLFLARVLPRTPAEDLPLPLVVHAFVRVSGADEGETPSRQTAQVGEVLIARVKASFDKEWESVEAAVPDLARHSRRFSLGSSGLRASLLSGLYARRPDFLMQPAFWRDVSLGDLVQAVHGPLRSALNDPDLADLVVEPLVIERLDNLATRRALGDIVALPSAFTRFVEPEKLSAAMRRVGANDPTFRAWHEVISRTGALAEAQAQAIAAQGAADAERQRAESASAQLENVQGALNAANALIQQSRKANQQARDAGNRQAKVDVLRSLASLAIAVKESSAAERDPALLQRVDFTLKREGLIPISAAGDSVPYDPAVHDALGTHLEPGSQVFVLRPGYTYSTGESTLALVKAQVHATQEE